jgi:hypothetical protein
MLLSVEAEENGKLPSSLCIAHVNYDILLQPRYANMARKYFLPWYKKKVS